MTDPVDTVPVPLTQAQINAAISALYTALTENKMNRRPSTPLMHDACCSAEARRAAVRADLQEALEEQGRRIEGAIVALESKENRG